MRWLFLDSIENFCHSVPSFRQFFFPAGHHLLLQFQMRVRGLAAVGAVDLRRASLSSSARQCRWTSGQRPAADQPSATGQSVAAGAGLLEAERQRESAVARDYWVS